MYRLIKLFAILSLGLGGAACVATTSEEGTENTRFSEYNMTASAPVGSKVYQVSLPASYHRTTDQRYPVLYMMDGQNLFFDSLSYSGHAWHIREVADSLAELEEIPEVIIVGINNAGARRFAEYMPQKPAHSLPSALRDSIGRFMQHDIFSDDFLRFLVEKLKPLIDEQYRTQPGVATSFVGGSSMGGLISMYALCEYPSVFGGAMCLSTHWPVSLDNSIPALPNALIDYFSDQVPRDKKWYFDYGSEGLDQYYEPHQLRIDSILQEQGYEKGEQWLTRSFPGDDHSERSWHRRLAIPLHFLFQ